MAVTMVDKPLVARASTQQRVYFFDLPAEIRLRIYEAVLVQPPTTLDLDPLNYRHVLPRLSCFLVCRRMHEEAYHVFYGTPSQPIRLFPLHGRFWHTKKPLLSRLGVRYRRAINTLDLRLGPGWSALPRCWHTGPLLGLSDCHSVRTLKIMVELDPSDDFLSGWRGKGNTIDTYQLFCVRLLEELFEQLPTLEKVELDGWPGVSKEGPLIRSLIREIIKGRKRLVWGPLHGWDKEVDTGGLLDLEEAIAAMSI